MDVVSMIPMVLGLAEVCQSSGLCVDVRIDREWTATVNTSFARQRATSGSVVAPNSMEVARAGTRIGKVDVEGLGVFVGGMLVQARFELALLEAVRRRTMRRAA